MTWTRQQLAVLKVLAGLDELRSLQVISVVNVKSGAPRETPLLSDKGTVELLIAELLIAEPRIARLTRGELHDAIENLLDSRASNVSLQPSVTRDDIHRLLDALWRGELKDASKS